MMPPKRHNQEENLDSWLMSYADMITLLMCFFIIFISVSEPKNDKFSMITEGIANKFGTLDLSTPFEAVAKSLQATVEHHQMLKDVSVEKHTNDVEMEISAGTFFNKDSADFNEGQLPVLTELADSLKKIDIADYRVIIESHTSDAVGKSPNYASNWELSAARAAHVARLLVEDGIAPDRIRASGYADAHPKVPNRDKDGEPILENMEKNQRVVIKLEKDQPQQ